MTSFSFFKYFGAFELDVNVVNFVYHGKTQFEHLSSWSLTEDIDTSEFFRFEVNLNLSN